MPDETTPAAQAAPDVVAVKPKANTAAKPKGGRTRKTAKPTHIAIKSVRTVANGRVKPGTPVACNSDEATRLAGLKAIKSL